MLYNIKFLFWQNDGKMRVFVVMNNVKYLYLTEKSAINIKTTYFAEKIRSKCAFSNVKNQIFFMKNLYY